MAATLIAFVVTLTWLAPARFVSASGEDVAPIKVVAFGDSLIAGYGLETGQGFPEQLERALRSRGHQVDVINAGVSGDTMSAAAARLDWALGEGADGVIVVLGGNDFLRGIDPARSRQSMDRILRTLADRDIPTLVGGMPAPFNMDPDYRASFDAIYPELTREHGAMLEPFFLEGVALVSSLNQNDGIHPNADGVAKIIDRMMPQIEMLLEKAKSARADS